VYAVLIRPVVDVVVNAIATLVGYVSFENG
jgi:hypothetical protein